MAKRFGRNQRRKLREQVASAERVLNAAKSSYHELWHENSKLQAKLRRSIEIDVSVLRDNARGHYEALMEAHRLGHEGLYVAQRLDERRLAMEHDRERFIEHVSRMMAVELARAIGARW